jgi:hypothetical protein
VSWAKSAVRVTLTNPRYTGHQVWNKQRTDEVLLDVNDVALGYTAVMRSNARDKWIFSASPVHEAIIGAEEFAQAQQTLASRGTRPGGSPNRSRQVCIFKGLVDCVPCGRIMPGHHAHGATYYRCRPLQPAADHPRNIYLREELLAEPLDAWLATAFAGPARARTIDAMLEAQDDVSRALAIDRLRTQIATCENKIARYRATLDAGGDPAIVAGWTTQAQAERVSAQAQLRALERARARPMTRREIAGLVDDLGELAYAIREADGAEKAKIYRGLGLRLHYDHRRHTVTAEAQPPRGQMGGVGEASRTICPRPSLLVAELSLGPR